MRSLFLAVCFVFALSSSAFAQFFDSIIAEIPIGGGPIAIRNISEWEVSTTGLDFQSTSGDLIPGPLITGDDGELRPDPGPFAFTLANSPNQVVYGNLGTATSFPVGSCTVLPAGVQPNAGEILFGFSGGPAPIFGTVARVESVCAVPEPSSLFLLTLTAFAMLLRRPRSDLGTKR